VQWSLGFNLQHPAFAEMDILDQYDFVNDDDTVGDQAGEDNYKSPFPVSSKQ
jgi:hypothetical protein